MTMTYKAKIALAVLGIFAVGASGCARDLSATDIEYAKLICQELGKSKLHHIVPSQNVRDEPIAVCENKKSFRIDSDTIAEATKEKENGNQQKQQHP